MSGRFPHSFVPGAQIGRYVIHERIARGGMGEVWLATAHGAKGFAKKVVLKTILPALARDPAYIAMLINEASIVAQLNHPNIVQVFDLECVEGRYFIAMEYLPGRTLSQLLQLQGQRMRRIPLWLALKVVGCVCDGLQYAHDYADDDGRALGILHRDMSPSNIMLTFTGAVSILDFGIAKAASASSNSGGVLKGKYHYLAPERILGKPCDGRSDIYSLGVVLYQLLAGRRPFRASNDAELLERVVQGSPARPKAYAPWLSDRLDRCVLRALSTNPNERYQEARDLAVELRGCALEARALCEPADVAAFLREAFAPPIEPPAASGAGAGPSPADERSDDAIPIEVEDVEVCEEVVAAVGSDRATNAPDPTSIWDRRWRPDAGDAGKTTADLFGPRARPRVETDKDFFSAGSDEPPFVGEPEVRRERSWPWAPALRKTK